MGHHLVNPDRRYDRLQERLDRNVTGAPDSPAVRRGLEILFSPEDADLASKVPTKPIRVDRLAPRLDLDPARLDERLADMARRGLVFDLTKGGKRHVSLAPSVIGFFELTFMRASDDLPRTERARLFEEYFFEGDAAFAKAVFGGDTQIRRSLVRETALPADATEVLDHERATRIGETARSAAVSLCACRHHSEHLDTACDAPRRVCLSFGPGADALVRTGYAERIDRAEALRILHEAQAAGLAQTGDNVKHEMGDICNCCGCCCGMMRAFKTHGMTKAIVSSSFPLEVDRENAGAAGRARKRAPSTRSASWRSTSAPGGAARPSSIRRSASAAAAVTRRAGSGPSRCGRARRRSSPRRTRSNATSRWRSSAASSPTSSSRTSRACRCRRSGAS